MVLKFAILETSTTPNHDFGGSPEQCLLFRTTRSFLPMSESLLAQRGDDYLESERQGLMNVRNIVHLRKAKEVSLVPTENIESQSSNNKRMRTVQ